MNLPSISIIIPIYKSQDYIEDCLKSIIHQDYSGPMECILIDDCSPDNSIALAEHYIQAHESPIKFHILHHNKNQKQSAARNTGMRAASGDYIFFLDSDDWITPSAIRKMADCLQENPGCQLVQAGISCDNTEYEWLSCQNWKERDLKFSDDRQWIIDTCSARFDMIPMTPVCKLMSRKFLEDNHFLFVEGIYHEDEIWLARLAKYLHTASFCHEDLYIYRMHEGSTTNGGQVRHYNDWKQVWLEIFKLFDQNFCPARMLKQIDFDTSYFLSETKDTKTKLMLLGIRLRSIQYYPLRQKLHQLKCIIKELFLLM